jgi:hypothetical protein
MERRLFLAGAGAAVAASPVLSGVAQASGLPVPPGNKIGFKVFRNGAAVGEHDMSFAQDGDDLAIATNFAFVVTLASIPVYRYSLSAVEKWSGGVFQSVASTVNNNGDQVEVHAHKTAAGYDVVGINHSEPAKSYPEYTAPPDTLPLTYWNKAMLNGTVLNVATAHSYPPIVNSPGWNKLPTASGGTLTAQRFDVTGKLRLSVWYDQMAQWAGLQFSLRGDWNYEKMV